MHGNGYFSVLANLFNVTLPSLHILAELFSLKIGTIGAAHSENYTGSMTLSSTTSPPLLSKTKVLSVVE